MSKKSAVRLAALGSSVRIRDKLLQGQSADGLERRPKVGFKLTQQEAQPAGQALEWSVELHEKSQNTPLVQTKARSRRLVRGRILVSIQNFKPQPAFKLTDDRAWECVDIDFRPVTTPYDPLLYECNAHIVCTYRL